MTVIAFDNVYRAYRPGDFVLHGVSFCVAEGEVVGLLGKNGAGKTTLLRLALGLLEPQKGSVRVFGQNPRRDAATVKRRIGYVAEDQNLPPFLTVAQVIEMHRCLYPSWDDHLVKVLGARFCLSASARVGHLSKGQVRQVALLCAAAHRPELFLLDEPAGGLDPAARREFLEASIELLNEIGATILFSSHHLTDVERMARRIVMLEGGFLYLDSEVDELREGYSLAKIPAEAVAEPDRLLELPDCLGVRRRRSSVHAIFRCCPASCQALLVRELGIANARCAGIALEEMFVELVGSVEPLDQSATPARAKKSLSEDLKRKREPAGGRS